MLYVAVQDAELKGGDGVVRRRAEAVERGGLTFNTDGYGDEVFLTTGPNAQLYLAIKREELPVWIQTLTEAQHALDKVAAERGTETDSAS
ncbi:hypothetical protein GCM10012275_32070 [Longimycelium tulufanense]|uniref:Uncharacterized protein n=1 Tax=Longimycelium tulufanense TaxID=907463 RepID=A0A8J3FUW5_9PSEU|nr:hypothetical protein [Longimycelium tulufanense]GGM58451.1 hypothetical protein GCM10012275_32070 [Longimycelium tulufanense]